MSPRDLLQNIPFYTLLLGWAALPGAQHRLIVAWLQIKILFTEFGKCADLAAL